MRRALALVVGCASCSSPGGGGGGGTSHVANVLSVPAVEHRDVDLLVMIDDSPSTLDWQVALRAAFPSFATALSAHGGLPNLHIGVVTSDLGTSATDGTTAAAIPGAVGGCANDGKGGELQTFGATTLTGTFISDIANPDGSRAMNYTGTLAQAFDEITMAGSAGCGFEQSLSAVLRALDDNVANAGFLRPNASLAILLLTDEDDCSLAHSTLLDPNDASLGALTSFRCTRFGVTCETDGQTPSAMAQLGPKSQCHSNEASAYLEPVAAQATHVKALVADPRQITVAAIIGDPAPVTIEASASGSGGTLPALAASCTTTDSMDKLEVAAPGVRVAEFAGQFTHEVVRSICADMTATLAATADQIRSTIGDTCVLESIALPADCVVTDETLAGAQTNVPLCPASGTCYELVPDDTCSASHLRLSITRASAPDPTTVSTLTCVVP